MLSRRAFLCAAAAAAVTGCSTSGAKSVAPFSPTNLGVDDYPNAGDYMSKAIENLQGAQKRAIAVRPKVGGFPYLAETFRQAGITRNFWFLPACQSLFLSKDILLLP